MAFSEPQYEAMLELSALQAGGGQIPLPHPPLGLPISPCFPLEIFEPDKTLTVVLQ